MIILPEIILQSMPNKRDSTVLQKSQLNVGGFERRKVFLTEISIEVTRFDPREFRQVINHLFLRRNVIIDERSTFHGSLTLIIKQLDLLKNK